MMTPIDCRKAWVTVCDIYDETIEVNNPSVTMEKIIETLKFEEIEEVFATVAAFKKHDGRIYGNNRKYMDSISVNPECVERDHRNAMFSCLLDHIHTAHINNLITELYKMKEHVDEQK